MNIIGCSLRWYEWWRRGSSVSSDSVLRKRGLVRDIITRLHPLSRRRGKAILWRRQNENEYWLSGRKTAPSGETKCFPLRSERTIPLRAKMQLSSQLFPAAYLDCVQISDHLFSEDSDTEPTCGRARCPKEVLLLLWMNRRSSSWGG